MSNLEGGFELNLLTLRLYTLWKRLVLWKARSRCKVSFYHYELREIEKVNIGNVLLHLNMQSIDSKRKNENLIKV